MFVPVYGCPLLTCPLGDIHDYSRNYDIENTNSTEEIEQTDIDGSGYFADEVYRAFPTWRDMIVGSSDGEIILMKHE